jgi:hypothetical protein
VFTAEELGAAVDAAGETLGKLTPGGVLAGFATAGVVEATDSGWRLTERGWDVTAGLQAWEET